ncbi:MAG: hypothetical protein R6Y91_01635 [Desulfohalobium sp.]
MKPQRFLRLLCWLWVLGALALLQACAPKSPPPQEIDAAPEKIWQRFQSTHNASAPSRDFWLKSSLNYSGEQGSHRIIFTLWGNLDHPLRMDLQAGIGTTFSLWREDASDWIAYYPSKELAYTHDNDRLGAQSLGLATPFDLQELALVLTGRLAAVVPQQYQSASSPSTEVTRFTFAPSADIQTLDITASGHAVNATGRSPRPWTLTFSDFPSTKSAFARKVTLESGEQHKAIVHIKELRWREEKWDPDALRLEIPSDTVKRRFQRRP